MEKYKLQTLLTIKNGKDYKNIPQGEYPVFGTGGLMCKISEYLYDKPSILLPRKGTLSNIQYTNFPFWTVDTLYYTIINQDIVNPYYLYCYLKNLDLSGLDSGASIPSMTFKSYYGINVFLPDLATQNKIASILSAYDDLIEKNNRRMEILRGSAEELYKEWFVRFRFPNHQNTKFINGIPQGWEYKPFGEVVSFERGISYSSQEIDCDDGINLINLKNINAYGGFRFDGTKKYNGKYRNAQIVKCGDLIMGVTDMTQDRRTVGAVALIPHFENVCVISADLIKLVCKIDNLFIYCLCRYGYYSKFFSLFSNGSNVLHLKPASLKNKKVLIPTDELIGSFVKIVKPINEIINDLTKQNELLKQQRDLLLPRLMSGKINVTP